MRTLDDYVVRYSMLLLLLCKVTGAISEFKYSFGVSSFTDYAVIFTKYNLPYF